MARSYNPSRYRSQSSTSLYNNLMESYGQAIDKIDETEKKLHASEMETLMWRRVADGLFFAIRSGDIESMKAACEVYKDPRGTEAQEEPTDD